MIRTVSIIAVLLAVSAGGTPAALLEVALYDTTPESGGPKKLSCGASILQELADGSNFPRPANADAKITTRAISADVMEYTFTPSKPARFLVLVTLRVDRWRMVDMRSVWIDYSRCTKLRPFTFRSTRRANVRGPYSTGDTTVLMSDAGHVVVKLTTSQPGHVFVGDGPLTYTVELTGTATPATGVKAFTACRVPAKSR